MKRRNMLFIALIIILIISTACSPEKEVDSNDLAQVEKPVEELEDKEEEIVVAEEETEEIVEETVEEKVEDLVDDGILLGDLNLPGEQYSGNKLVDNFIKIFASDNFMIEYEYDAEESTDPAVRDKEKVILGAKDGDRMFARDFDTDIFIMLATEDEVYNIYYEDKSIVKLSSYNKDTISFNDYIDNVGNFDLMYTLDELELIEEGRAEFLGKEESYVDFLEKYKTKYRIFYNEDRILALVDESINGTVVMKIKMISDKPEGPYFGLPEDFENFNF